MTSECGVAIVAPEAFMRKNGSSAAAVGTPFASHVSLSSTNRMALAELVPTNGGAVEVTCADGFKVYVYGYDAEGLYLGYAAGCSKVWYEHSHVADFDGASFVSVMVSRTSDGTITPSDAPDVMLGISFEAGGGGSMTTFAEGHGTNLFSYNGWSDEAHALPNYQSRGGFLQANACLTVAPESLDGRTLTLSLEARSPNGTTSLQVYNRNGTPAHFGFDVQVLTSSLGADWERLAVTFVPTSAESTTSVNYWNRLEIYAPSQMGVEIRKVMLELGDVAHPWTPSPLDEGVVGMIKALDEVTITDQTDVDSLVTWYKLTTSATKPDAPTTAKTSDAVSGWTTAEPTFSAGDATNYLYTVQQTRWKDGSCEWGSVQLSSSYEQAKQAWNKANAAVKAAGDVQANLDAAQPFVVDEQTAATRWWRADCPGLTELKDGQQLTIWLSHAHASSTAQSQSIAASELTPTETVTSSYSNVWLKLTLGGGSDTGWIPCYYSGESRLTSHYGIKNAVHLTYRAGVSSAIPRGWWADANYDSNTYGYGYLIYFSGKVSAARGIWQTQLFMEDSEGTYQGICTASDGTITTANRPYNSNATTFMNNVKAMKASTAGFKVASQIYYLNGGSQNKDGTLNGRGAVYTYNSNVVDSRYSFNPYGSGTTLSLVANKPLYLVGTVHSDGLFYLDSTWHTQTPNDESKVYVLVGNCYDTYRFMLAEQNAWLKWDGSALVDYQKWLSDNAQSTADNAAPKSDAVARSQRIYWRATSASGKPSANTTWLSTSGDGYGNWSLNVPKLVKDGTSTKYPYLYTAMQSQTVAQQAAGATCSCSAVLIDDTAVVIDGGSLIAGSVTANKLNAADINASNSLTIGAMTTETQAAIDNANVVVGGRNLLRGTGDAFPKAGTASTYFIEFTVSNGSLKNAVTLEVGETYTLSADVTSSVDGFQLSVGCGNGSFSKDVAAKSGLNSGRVFVTFTPTAEHLALGSTFAFRAPRYGSSKSFTYTVDRVKLEKGNKATDWTPAPEDQEALVTSTRSWYATCDTAAATVAKVATTADDGFELREGVVVDVKFANTNSGAVGSLTLNVNGTGAKAIKTMYNNSLANLTTAGQLYAGLVVRFVYSGAYWIASTNYNSDTVDRKRINNAVRVAENVTAYAICGRSGTGHKKLVSGLAIDLSYPIAYLAAGNISGQSYAVASGGTATAFYTAIPSVNLQYTKSGWTGTQYAMCYVKGTLSGSTFTVHSDVFTTTVPTSDDGLAYVPIGMLYAANYVNFDCDNTVYGFRNGSFQKLDTVANYITADANGIKIHMAGNSTTYQHQSANATTFYVGGKKRSQVGADGLHVYVDTTETEVAKFTASGAQIGKTSESHILQDYHSMQMVDKENKTYFHVSDLRGTNGLVSVTDTFVAESNGVNLQLAYKVSSLISVTSNGTDVTSGCTVTETTVYAGEVSYLTSVLHGSWAAGATVVCTYTTSSELTKGLTFGVRGSAAIGGYSSSFGYGNDASGFTAFASGQANDATGISSHAEGYNTTASGHYAHAEGDQTSARERCSHAEGSHTIAYEASSHAEGVSTSARGVASHAEGVNTNASGTSSHAEGAGTTASGDNSHAQNTGTIAAYKSQTAIGKYNANQSTNAFEVGNGTDSARSNALIVDWDGNLIAQGMAGMVQMFAGSTAPTGWLMCDGSAVSRTTYATLFAVIGTTWGSGDGSTTFNLPDLRGRAPIGAGTGSGLTARTLAATGGSQNIQAHTHAFTQPTVKTELKFQKNAASGSAVNRVAGSNLSNPADTSTYTATVTGGAVGAVSGASTGTAGNMPPFTVINFIICTGKTS